MEVFVFFFLEYCNTSLQFGSISNDGGVTSLSPVDLGTSSTTDHHIFFWAAVSFVALHYHLENDVYNLRQRHHHHCGGLLSKLCPYVCLSTHRVCLLVHLDRQAELRTEEVGGAGVGGVVTWPVYRLWIGLAC